jgi:hypothetical protein
MIHTRKLGRLVSDWLHREDRRVRGRSPECFDVGDETPAEHVVGGNRCSLAMHIHVTTLAHSNEGGEGRLETQFNDILYGC